MTERTAEKAQHPTPPGPPRPPSPPTHEHPDGARCMWVRHNFIDRWRLVDATGRDLGPCPGFEQPATERRVCERCAFVPDGDCICDEAADRLAQIVRGDHPRPSHSGGEYAPGGVLPKEEVVSEPIETADLFELFIAYRRAVAAEKRTAVLIERAIYTDADLEAAQAADDAAHNATLAADDALTQALLDLRYPPAGEGR